MVEMRLVGRWELSTSVSSEVGKKKAAEVDGHGILKAGITCKDRLRKKISEVTGSM
jgi:hypothetical protein